MKSKEDHMLRFTMEMLQSEGLADGMTQDILDAHMESLNEHVAYVQEACRMLGGLSEQQIAAHDLSKYSIYEFPHYARQFKGPKNDPDGFAYAWMHHIHKNPHHPEHWVIPGGDRQPSRFRENSSDMLAEVNKFIKAHIALGTIDANSNPLQVIEFVRASLALGDNVVDARVKSWNKLFSGDRAPIVLFFQLAQKAASESFIIMTAGIPDDCSPMEQTILPTSGEGWFATSDAKSCRPMLLTKSFAPISVLGLSDYPLLFGHFDVCSSPLSSLFMQSSKLNQFSSGHLSFASDRETHVVALALDAQLGSSKLFGEQRGTICLIPTSHDLLFFGCPSLGESFVHTNLQYPVLNSLLVNTGYYTMNYKWQQFAVPVDWQHWIFPDGFTPKNSRVENGVVQMPTNYVVEMVADWMGASKAYTGSWDMTDWLLANLPKIKIHSQTATYLERVLTLNGACDYTMVFMTLRSHGAW